MMRVSVRRLLSIERRLHVLDLDDVDQMTKKKWTMMKKKTQ